MNEVSPHSPLVRESTETAPRTLFDRPAPPDYLEEWTARLAQPPQEAEEDLRSLVILRLGLEWLALRTQVLVEVTLLHPIHTIPHRTGEVLLGLVNIRGQLRICVSLHGLLGVEADASLNQRRGPATSVPTSAEPTTGRMAILQDQNAQWAFLAVEVVGVQRIRVGMFRKVPSTFGKSASYCRSVFDWNGHTVGCLDEERLLPALRSLCQ